MRLNVAVGAILVVRVLKRREKKETLPPAHE